MWRTLHFFLDMTRECVSALGEFMCMQGHRFLDVLCVCELTLVTKTFEKKSCTAYKHLREAIIKNLDSFFIQSRYIHQQRYYWKTLDFS